MFPPDPVKSKGKEKEEARSKEDELVIDNFDSGSEDGFDVICNVVLVLLREYDYITEVSEPVDYDEEEMTRHKHVCCFILNNGCIKEHNMFFERSDE